MQATDFYVQKVFHCSCLLNVIDNIYELDFRILSKILLHLHTLEKFPINTI